MWIIDIGNTSLMVCTPLKAGGYKSHKYAESEIPNIIQKIAKSRGKSLKIVLVCSVVPIMCAKLIKGLKRYKNVKIIRIGYEIPLGIKSRYKNHSKLGVDRQVNAYGALKIDKPPFLIFDFGTATTVDYISAKGVIEGGMILPGVESSLDLMHEKTALLPSLRLKKSLAIVGRDTQSCMLSGVLNGYGVMVNGLTDLFRKKYGKKIKTIGTGGLVDILSGYCKPFNYKDKLHTIRSMEWIYQDWLKHYGKKNNG